MRQIISVTAAIVCLLSASAVARDYFYYDLDGSPYYLQVCDSIVNIQLDSLAASKDFNALALDQPGLQDDYTPHKSYSGFWTYGVEPGYDYDQMLAEVRADTLVDFATPVFQVDDSLLIYEGNAVLVRFYQGAAEATLNAILSSYSLNVVQDPIDLHIPDGYVLQATANSPDETLDICNAVYQFTPGAVRFAVPNFGGDLLKFQYTPSDEYYADWQWHLKKGAGINMEEAWEFRQGQYRSVTAIVDVGFDLDHEDFDHDSYVWPFDAAGISAFDEPISTVDFDPRIPLTEVRTNPASWHGTAAMGIFAAITDNNRGVAAASGDLKTCPIKISDDGMRTNNNAIWQALWWPYDADADVAVVTFTGQSIHLPEVEDAIRSSYERGIAWIAASSNGIGYAGFPGWMDEVLTVTGTNLTSDPLNTGHGSTVDISAPAVMIATTDLTGPYGYSSLDDNCMDDDDYTCNFGGTSAAAAQVAGVAALIVSRRPELLCNECTPEALYDILRHTADDGVSPNDPPGWDEYYGYGKLNARNAVLAVSRGDANNDGQFSISDAVFMINYIFGGGDPPTPDLMMGDADGSGSLSIGDAVQIINYIFGGGPAPVIVY